MKRINKQWHKAFNLFGINSENQIDHKNNCVFYAFHQWGPFCGPSIGKGRTFPIYRSHVMSIVGEIDVNLVRKTAKISIPRWSINCSYLNKKTCATIIQKMSLKIDEEIDELVRKGYMIDYTTIPSFLFDVDDLPYNEVLKIVTENMED